MKSLVILLVDDEKTVLDSLKQQLRLMFGQRFLYETAESVKEAWEVLDELEDDKLVLIVSDWLMPNVRGDQFLLEVNERYPDVVRVMLTGQADQDALERACKQAKVHKILYKPWNPKELQETIEEGLAI
jgi:DNA-binding NtrC family response regulator